MNLNSTEIAIGLITSYPKWYKGKIRSIKHTDKVRGDLALSFVVKAKEQQYQIVVSDKSSAKTFFKELKSLTGITLLRRNGVKASFGKRQVIKKIASMGGIKVIVLAEPEKLGLIASLPLLVQPILDDEADMVIPKRDDELFKKTYPHYMYESEIEGNIMYNEILRVNGFLKTSQEDLDMFFGPRVIANKPSLVRFFLKKYILHVAHISFPSEYFDTEKYSNGIFFPVINALRKKFRVKSITIPFSYPHIQKENEEKGVKELFIEKRKSQRLGLLIELLHFVSYLEGSGLHNIHLKRKRNNS